MARTAARSTSRVLLLLYSAPLLPLNIMIFPLVAVVPAFYSTHTRATLAQVGLMVMIARFSDLLVDPLVGYLSDRYDTRIGRRLPWILLGGLLVALGSVFLFTPDADVGVLYFGAWSIVVYAGWAMIDIPYKAWGNELVRDYNERCRLVAYRSVFSNFGFLVFLVLPLIPSIAGGEVNAEVLRVSALFIAIALPLLLLVAARWVPRGTPIPGAPPQFSSIFTSIRKNRPFQLFLIVYFLTGIAIGASGSLYYLYLDKFLLIPERFSVIAVSAPIASLLGMPLWLKIVAYVGKPRAWAYGNLLVGAMTFATLWIRPGEGAFLPYLIVSIFTGIGVGVIWIVPMALLGDVIDFDTLQTRVDRSGMYFSTYLLVYKFNIAIGGGIGFALLAFFGFEPKLATQSVTATHGILFSYAVLPGLCYVAAALLLLRFPLNARRQGTITRRLEQRVARSRSNGVRTIGNVVHGTPRLDDT